MIDLFGRTLEEVRPVVINDVNEVAVCKDIKTSDKFVVVRLKGSEITKKVLKMLYNRDGNSFLPGELFVGGVVNKGDMVLVFNYLPERRLFSYIKSDSYSSQYTISVIRSFLFKLISLKMPPPLIRLLLAKDNINLKEDGSVYFGTLLDFEKMNFETRERDCLSACLDVVNNIILEFDVGEDEKYRNLEAVKLFLKKYRNGSYRSVVEIYNDFKLKRLTVPHFYDNWYAAFLKPSRLFKVGKILMIAIFICAAFMLASWLLDKSSFMIGFKNRKLDVIGTVVMTLEK
ncbi:MAG: hypothetical protein LBB04_03155 [Oscillospiraceae bacterium]|jgi:hypothetical protein|nr:hypothetical protein [Oscillospiraceae bacterium]